MSHASNFLIETRVSTVGELQAIAGKPGRRAVITTTGNRYYWDGGSWVAETGPATVLGYDQYSCQVFQSSGQPYDNVLGEPSIGGFLTWEKMDVGVYRATLEGAFPEYRTQLFYNGVILSAGAVASPPSSPPSSSTALSYVRIERIDDDTLLLTQVDDTLNPKDGLDGLDLEIRVYASNSLRD